jgi:hypothetical protein
MFALKRAFDPQMCRCAGKFGIACKQASAFSMMNPTEPSDPDLVAQTSPEKVPGRQPNLATPSTYPLPGTTDGCS